MTFHKRKRKNTLEMMLFYVKRKIERGNLPKFISSFIFTYFIIVAPHALFELGDNFHIFILFIVVFRGKKHLKR